MLVRTAKIEDADALFELNSLFENETSIEQIKKSLLENDRETVCIAFIDGISVGYCCGSIVKSMCYKENRADIESLYVKDGFRKRGVGKALMLCMENTLALLGIYHFHLNTNLTNKNAQQLYEEIGCEITNEILMHKSIARVQQRESDE